MQLVIDIPEELLEYFANHNCMSEDGWFSHSSKLLDAFRNGTPLPKGHGAIVDLKQVIRIEIEEPHTGKKMVWNNNPKINDTTWRMVTPTIIEATKGEDE